MSYCIKLVSDENQTWPHQEALQHKYYEEKPCPESLGTQQHLRQLIDTVIVLGNGTDVKSGLKKLWQVGVVWHYEFNLCVLLGKGKSLLLICPAKEHLYHATLQNVNMAPSRPIP